MALSFPGARDHARSLFYDDFGRLLEAGLPVGTALRTLGSESRDSIARHTAAIEAQIREGASLAEAFERAVPSLDRFERHALDGAERSGKLPEVMRRLSAYYKARGEAKQTIAAGMAYPLFLVHLAILLPSLAILVGQGLPAYLRAVLPPLLVLWGLAVGGWLAVRAARRSEAGRRAVSNVALSLPIVGRLVRKAALADYAESLGVLHRAGVPISEALERAADSVRSAPLADAGRRVTERVARGDRLADAFAAEEGPLFTRAFVESVRVAETSGAFDETFDRAARLAREDADRLLERVTAVLPLVVYLGAAGHVAYVVISFYAGMYRGLL